MLTLPTSITFKKEINGSGEEITIPEEFIKDFYSSSDNHLMVILRVLGQDSKKVENFFKESENELFTIETKLSEDEEKSEQYILSSAYIDEGPAITVDITQELLMVRTILDFERK